MSKDSPPTYEIPAVGLYYRCGFWSVFEVIGEVVGDRVRGARVCVMGSAAGTLGSAKKVVKSRAFFLRKFCKVNNFAYICIEKNTKPIQL